MNHAPTTTNIRYQCRTGHAADRFPMILWPLCLTGTRRTEVLLQVYSESEDPFGRRGPPVEPGRMPGPRDVDAAFVSGRAAASDPSSEAAPEEVVDDPYDADYESAFSSVVTLVGWLMIGGVALAALVAILWIMY